MLIMRTGLILLLTTIRVEVIRLARVRAYNRFRFGKIRGSEVITGGIRTLKVSL